MYKDIFESIRNEAEKRNLRERTKLATTSSTGGLSLALQRPLLLLAPKGGIASTFTGPL